MFAEPANTLCLSSCKQHEAFQAAAAIVAAAEAEQREAEEEQEAEEEAIEVGSEAKSEEGSEEESEAGTGSTARHREKRARIKEIDRFDPDREANRPQRATAAKKKHQTRNAGYSDNDVDALFRGEVEKFTSSLTTELARR